MQLGNGIYYSTCSLKAQHVSSVTSLIIRSSQLYLQPLVYIRVWYAYVNQGLQIQLGLLMMRVVPLETC